MLDVKWNTIIEWIMQNWVVILVFILGLISWLGSRDWKNVREAAGDLFLLAEKALADHIIKSGPEAMVEVVTSLYKVLPACIRTVLGVAAILMGTTPEALLKRLAQRWYDAIKDKYKLAYGRRSRGRGWIHS